MTMSRQTPTISTASARQQTPANTPATIPFHLDLVHLFCSIRSRFWFQTHLRPQPNNNQQAILATIPFSNNATYIIAFLQQCALRSQDFDIYHRECIESENPDRCGSAISPDSVRKISCLFKAINDSCQEIFRTRKIALSSDEIFRTESGLNADTHRSGFSNLMCSLR